MCVCVCVCVCTCACTYIYMVTPPLRQTVPFKTSLPPACSCLFRGIEFEPSERVREEPPDDRNQKTKAPRRMLEQFCVFGFLVLWFFVFFYFFGSLFFWLFGFIVERVIFQKHPKNQKPKEPKPKNQKTKKPKNQRTKEPKNQKTKTVPAFSVELWFFGFLVSVVGWFFTDTFGGLKLDTPEKAD